MDQTASNSSPLRVFAPLLCRKSLVALPLSRSSVLKPEVQSLILVWGVLWTRVRLGLENDIKPGHVCKLDLGNATLEQIPPWPQLNRLDISLDPIIWLQLGLKCCCCCFFLFVCLFVCFKKTSSLKRRKVKISDIFTYVLLDDLLVIRKTFPREVKKWIGFSTSPLLKVFIQFVPLDKAHNHVLRKEELSFLSYGIGTFFFNGSLLAGAKIHCSTNSFIFFKLLMEKAMITVWAGLGRLYT